MTNQPRGGFGLELVADCDDVTRLVWLLLDDELTPPGAASMRIHLHECASCRAFVRFEHAFLRIVHAALRGPLREPSSSAAH